jgi:hypothetical protein
LADGVCWPPPTAPTAPTALAVIRLLKDSADTPDDRTWLANFVARLPAEIANLEEVRETNAFSLANAASVGADHWQTNTFSALKSAFGSY